MPTTTRRLTTPRTARLVQVGSLGPHTRLTLIACHGYGMDVNAFARRFEGLPGEVCVLCPEGLSRFYWGGFSGKPVASWMTSLERETEIADLCAWLQQVYVLAKAEAPGASVCAFGFSQGATTVMRWLHANRPAVRHVVLWSGTPPEDIDYAPMAYFDSLHRVAYWGDADELVPYGRARTRFEEVALKFEHRTFDGGHAVEPEPLARLVRQLLDD